jgi:APA family basic amino acid/polyamine antiporter
VSGDRLDAVLARARQDRAALDGGAFGTLGLTALGIASVVGAGIFVTTGVAAAQDSGPAVVLSFLLAAAATALCYAELAAMIPVSGSTYSYAYVAFGLFPAWFIGWDLLIEYLMSASTVAVGWSGYAESLFGLHVGAFNWPAVLLVLGCTGLLVRGTRTSARVNAAIVAVKLGVLVLVVVFGALHVHTANWSPFAPLGTDGVLRGAGIVFFAYIGFDAVSTAAGESRDPSRTVPRALWLTVLVATALYVAIGIVLTGLVSYTSLDVPDPISAALRGAGVGWLNEAVNVAAVVGLFSTVMVTLYGQVRVLMRMSGDGLLPPVFARVNQTTKTPVLNTVLCGAVCATVAAFVPITVLGDLVSIGTLFAFLLVCGGVLVLRRTHADAVRPVRVRALPLVATVGILGSLGLMTTLPWTTWVRLAVWLMIGLAIFFGYARRHAAAAPSATDSGCSTPSQLNESGSSASVPATPVA